MDGFIYAPNEEVKFSADSAYLPVNTGGCELTNLPLEQVSSDQAIWASSSFGSTIIDSSQVLGFNSVPEQDLNHFSMQNVTSFNNLQHQTNLNGGGLLTDQKDLNAINGLHNLSSFSSGSQMAFQTLHMPNQGTGHLMNQLPADATRVTGTGTGTVTCTSIGTGTGTGFDGTFKPRVRARRGQATDPHSIAERLRREKISERMKNLQELVPNSNRTDKASMLDEIIDYVKFLQLQVKVLSMSRLGATEAAVPLLTESQNELQGSTSNLTSVSIKSNSSEHESTTFEQEVVRLMESNVTSAMQYLQNKGLCLMPIALASAISTQKGTHTASIPTQRRNSGSNLDYVSLYEDVSGGGTN